MGSAPWRRPRNGEVADRAGRLRSGGASQQSWRRPTRLCLLSLTSRLFTALGPQPQAPPILPTPTRRPSEMTVECAQRFIASVRERFAARREVYDA